MALDSMTIDRTKILMVGDRVATDILGARQARIASVLVKTGEFKPDDLIGEIQPDYIIDALTDIKRFF